MENSISFLHALIFLCFIQLPTPSFGGGFTVDLIHRDSPISPLYDASKTRSDRLKSAFHRSHSRAAYFKEKCREDFQSPVIPSESEYLMNISVGTPPTPIYVIVDTGSDLTWTQCAPCKKCYRQIYPVFDPRKSSTYKPVSCRDQACNITAGAITSCVEGVNKCQYRTSYGDNSVSKGDIAMETFNFGSIAVPNLVFGCGHYNDGLFENTSTGIIGLGGADGSFANQLKSFTHGKFSYCFVDYDTDSNSTGKISFGEESVMSGPGVVSTPILQRPGYANTFYQLTLESVKIGKKKFGFRNYETGLTKGNIIIDSGTTLTLLPQPLVDDLERELKDLIKGKPSFDPSNVFSLCYNKTIVDIVVPDITFEFKGAEVVLPQSNTFVEIEDGLVCFGIVADSQISIFGNLVQVNFLVGYDIVKKTVSFKPTDCTKQ